MKYKDRLTLWDDDLYKAIEFYVAQKNLIPEGYEYFYSSIFGGEGDFGPSATVRFRKIKE